MYYGKKEDEALYLTGDIQLFIQYDAQLSITERFGFPVLRFDTSTMRTAAQVDQLAFRLPV